MIGDGKIDLLKRNWDRLTGRICEEMEQDDDTKEIKALQNMDRKFRNGTTMKASPVFKLYKVISKLIFIK